MKVINEINNDLQNCKWSLRVMTACLAYSSISLATSTVPVDNDIAVISKCLSKGADVPFPISSNEITKALADSGLPVDLAAKPHIMQNSNASDTATICALFNQQKLGPVLLNVNIVGIGDTLLSLVALKQSGVHIVLDLIWNNIIANMWVAAKAMPKPPPPSLPLWTVHHAPMFLLAQTVVQNMPLMIINANTGVINLTLDGDVNIKKPKLFKYYEFNLPPNTNHNWELWEVPVNVRSEAAIVFKIMHYGLRLVELTKTGESHPCTKPPRSTFAPLCMLGCILVEVWEWNDVVGICNGILGLPPFSITPGDWIHLKVALYMNDLAFVLQNGCPRTKPVKLQHRCLKPSLEVELQELDEKHISDNLEVVVVPHLDYKPPSPHCNPLSVTKIPDSLHSVPNSPPSALTLPTLIGAAPGPLFSSTSNSPPIRYYYHNLTFDISGFLLLSISLSQSSARELKEGDRVKVVGSTYADSIGVIKEFTPTYAYLLLLDSLTLVQIPCLFLYQYYKIGDPVTIKAGVDTELTGYIIAVNNKDDTVVICNPLMTMTQVATPIYYIEFAADRLCFRKPPSHGLFTIAKLAYMRDPTFAHLENLPIVVTKGPLKGCSEVVKSIAITGIASIEMNALSTQVNQLQQIKVQNLAFEQ
ncbi:hypothetical protein AN958_11708 [Leucoagaricus sp. SymC.cos]|nr:hypothetical protein AN958_11708 [Leucoagaricus sp. SymC.cos]